MNIAIRILAAAALVALCAIMPAYADSWLPQIGGPGGTQYSERCPQGQILNGFELRAGDDIDAIRAVCVTPSSPTAVSAPPLSNGFGGGWHGGGGGGLQRVLCPPDTPVVASVKVGYDGIDTLSLDTIDIYCSAVSQQQTIGEYPSNQFYAPVQGCDLDMFGLGDCAILKVTRQTCPVGEIAIGMHGRSGNLVDAMALICGPAPTFGPHVSMGHVRKETLLRRATGNATVTQNGSAATRSAVTRAAVKPKPAAAIKSSNARASKPAAADVNRKAIIIVGGKPQDKAKQPTLRERIKDYQDQHHD